MFFSKHISLYIIYIIYNVSKFWENQHRHAHVYIVVLLSALALTKTSWFRLEVTSPVVGSLLFFSITCFFPRHPRIYGHKSICITCAIEKLTIHGAP